MRYRRSFVFALFVAVTAGSAAWAADELTTTTPVPKKDEWWQRRHEKINARAKQSEVELIFIGDSITQGWEGDQAKPVWEKFYGNRKAMNAGIGGDRTQHVLWRLDNGNIDGITPKLAVVMIGTNNSGYDSPEDIAAGITAIVEKLREKLPETKVLLLGIFPRGPDADDAKRKSNIATNDIIKTLDDGKAVHYLDISDKFLAEDGTLSREIMPDLLHLNTKGYEIWAEETEPTVAKLLGE
ncbi:MAG TPA: platelet-activating factor acetylhydrolase IB subunit [Pirellulales bacterium]|nr:platelet-activating factor acetylhydrolase IB subunit [Pirellulales bacterium]